MNNPAKKFAAHRPIKGQIVTCGGIEVGIVRKVEGEICYLEQGQGTVFIWAFTDGLNNLHEWPTRAGGELSP